MKEMGRQKIQTQPRRGLLCWPFRNPRCDSTFRALRPLFFNERFSTWFCRLSLPLPYACRPLSEPLNCPTDWLTDHDSVGNSVYIISWRQFIPVINPRELFPVDNSRELSCLHSWIILSQKTQIDSTVKGQYSTPSIGLNSFLLQRWHWH